MNSKIKSLHKILKKNLEENSNKKICLNLEKSNN